MRILVVDDHALIREALRNVLKELASDVSVLEASNYREAMVHLEAISREVDLVLLDLGLPDRDGFATLTEVRQRFPTAPIVVLSALNDQDNVVRALNLGALGFIPKSASREVMLGALRLVFAGGIYIPPDILAAGRSGPAQFSPTAAPPPPVSPRELGLTERQAEVLALMMKGKSNKAICRALDLAEPTVKNHVTAILKTLNAANRTEAVVAAKDRGWDLPEPT